MPTLSAFAAPLAAGSVALAATGPYRATAPGGPPSGYTGYVAGQYVEETAFIYTDTDTTAGVGGWQVAGGPFSGGSVRFLNPRAGGYAVLDKPCWCSGVSIVCGDTNKTSYLVEVRPPGGTWAVAGVVSFPAASPSSIREVARITWPLAEYELRIRHEPDPSGENFALNDRTSFL